MLIVDVRMRYRSLQLLLIVAAHKSAAQHPVPCDRPIGPWLIAGTYAPDSASRGRTPPSGVDESALAPTAGARAPGAPAYLTTWTGVRPDVDGRIDFHDVYPLARYGGERTYAVTYIVSPADRTVFLGVESADHVWVWLNGIQLRDRGDRFFGENLHHDPDTAVLHLHRGINRLTYKVVDYGTTVGMAGWLLTSSPDPIADLAIGPTLPQTTDELPARPDITVGPVHLATRGRLVGVDKSHVDIAVIPIVCITRWTQEASADPLTLAVGTHQVTAPLSAPGVPIAIGVPVLWAEVARDPDSIRISIQHGSRLVARTPVSVGAQALLSLFSRPIEIDTESVGREPSEWQVSPVLQGLTIDTLPGRTLARVQQPGWREMVDGAGLARAFTGDTAIPIPNDTVARELLAAARDPSKHEYRAIVDHWMQGLAPLSERLHRDTIDAIGNSHIDAAWLWRVEQTKSAVDATWTTATKLLGYYPGMHFAASAAQYFVWMEQRDTATLHKIQALERAGRWHLVGGWWVEPDINMPSGESLVRQGLYGQRTFIRLFGHPATIAWTPDSFGYPWSLPQILAKSGFDSFIACKLRSNEQNAWPASRNVFWWEGPDGTKLVTYFPYKYDHDLNRDALVRQFEATIDSSASRRLLVLYGVGDHGGGPTMEMLDRAVDLSRAPTFPVMRDVDPARTMTKLKSDLEAKEAGAPVVRDELYLEHHRGVYTTHAEMKRWNRHMESLLRAAEAAAVAAGGPYPGPRLTEAWERTLFNQFHDLLSGSGIDSIYQDAVVDYAHADSLARGVLTEAVTRLAARLDTRGAGPPFAVFNPSGVSRTEVVRLPHMDGSEDTVVVTVPATSVRIVHASSSAVRAHSVSTLAGSLTLESAALRIEIDSTTGAIARLYDKRTHLDVVAPGANALVMLVDQPSGDDAWNIDNLKGARTWLRRDRTVSPVQRVGDAQIVEVSDVADSVRVVQRYILRDSSTRLDVESLVDWHQAHQLLKAVFPLAFHTDSTHAEIPYGVIGRPTVPVSRYDSARFETPMQRFVDADATNRSEGLALITDSKYGYSAHGDTLFLSLLRAPKSPDSTADMGHHRFFYSIVPHAGDWRSPAVREAATAINDPLIVVPVSAHTAKSPLSISAVSLTGSGVELTALKHAEDGAATVLRLVETAGGHSEATLRFGGALAHVTSVRETDLLERPTAVVQHIAGSSLTVHMAPWEIRTLVIY